MDPLGVIAWSSEHCAMACSIHGPSAIIKKSAGYSREQRMPLHVDHCRECGAESKPAIHADLGG